MFWIIALAAIAAFLYWVSRKPDHFVLSRSIGIVVPADKIFPLINNLKEMNSWNPFATDDPKSVMAYSGPESGKGATYTWSGGKSGAGSFEVLESSPPNSVVARLLMLKPVKADNKVEFTLKSTGSGTTTVTWAMSGNNAFIHKLFHTVMNMDKMVGGTFDRGLAALKERAEQKKITS